MMKQPDWGIGTSCYKSNMAANSSGLKKKKLVLLMMMMLQDEEASSKIVSRKVWARKWLLRRPGKGVFYTLFKELALEDSGGFREFMRMPYEKFCELAEVVSENITKQNTIMRMAIPPRERLALTLRFLVTGESFESLSFQFRIGKTTVGNIVLEVCSAIYDSLREEFLQTPNQIHKWQKIAGHFHFGAIDGKRIVILKPAHSGSHFHDYKGNESIIALVVAGPEYECLYADVGTNGCNPDGHAWSRCSLKKALDNPDNPLNIPADEPLPGRTKPIPFVLTGDEAFPLSRYMLKPYPNINLTVEQRIANYRISRGRRISETLLGIFVNRWRCFKVPFLLHPSKVKIITLAALTLHNWLRADQSSRNVYCPASLPDMEDPLTRQIIPGSWREDSEGTSFLPLQPTATRNYADDARSMREEFTEWFTNEGDLTWQRQMCGL